jgi:hypothetical protein
VGEDTAVLVATQLKRIDNPCLTGKRAHLSQGARWCGAYGFAESYLPRRFRHMPRDTRTGIASAIRPLCEGRGGKRSHGKAGSPATCRRNASPQKSHTREDVRFLYVRGKLKTEPIMSNMDDSNLKQWEQIIKYDFRPLKDGRLGAQCREAWRELYPRRYFAPGGWVSPRRAAVGYLMDFHRMASVLLKLPDKPTLPEVRARTDSATVADATIIPSLRRNKMPTFWLTKTFAEDMCRTANIPDLTLSELTWPRQAAQFILPEHLIRLGEGYVTHMSYALLKLGPSEGPEIDGVKVESKLMLGIYFSHISDGIRISIPFSLTLEDAADLSNCREVTDGEWHDEDDIVGNKVILLLVNTVMFMALRKADDLSTSAPEQWHDTVFNRDLNRPAEQKPPADIWYPNWVGVEYERKRKAWQGGSHASPRFHIRRQHWARRRYGPGRELTRFVLIEETPVNA